MTARLRLESCSSVLLTLPCFVVPVVAEILVVTYTRIQLSSTLKRVVGQVVLRSSAWDTVSSVLL